MLRNPTNRTISQYNHIHTYPNGNGWVDDNFLKSPHENLKSILTDKTRSSIITNIQTRYLSSPYNPLLDTTIKPNYLYDQNIQFIEFDLCHPYLSLSISLYRLIKMDFFGLQEYFPESLLMLSSILGIKAKIPQEKLGSYAGVSLSQLDQETIKLLHSNNHLDNKLYFIAKTIFEKRMLHFVNQRLHTNLNIINYLSNRDKYIQQLQSIMLQ